MKKILSPSFWIDLLGPKVFYAIVITIVVSFGYLGLGLLSPWHKGISILCLVVLGVFFLAYTFAFVFITYLRYREPSFKNRYLLLCLMLFIIYIYFFGIGYYAASTIENGIRNTICGNQPTLTDCFYFSIVTATTLGYGDFAPQGLGKLISSFEVLLAPVIIFCFVSFYEKSFE